MPVARAKTSTGLSKEEIENCRKRAATRYLDLARVIEGGGRNTIPHFQSQRFKFALSDPESGEATGPLVEGLMLETRTPAWRHTQREQLIELEIYFMLLEYLRFETNLFDDSVKPRLWNALHKGGFAGFRIRITTFDSFKNPEIELINKIL